MVKSNLKSFGCSFIHGTDLSDDGRTGPYATVSQLTWPALLAKHYQRTYSCFARPGAGNLQILEQTLNQAAISDSSDLFIVAWTWVDRFDHYDANYDPGRKRSPWSTILPNDPSEVATVYYKNLHSEYQDKFNSLCYIKLAIDTLQQKNIKFVMTYMDNLLFDTRWHNTTGVADLQKYVRPYLTTFDNMNFLDWSRVNEYPMSQTKHPLEQAHKSAADYMIKLVNQTKIIQ
jgi:hypothetical protein